MNTPLCALPCVRLIDCLNSLVAMDYSYSEIASFYAGRSVFLTGGTGFLGKV